MKKQNKSGIMLMTVFFLLCLMGTTLQAQSVIDIFDNKDNSITLHLTGQEENRQPDKILFVCDSNIITLESSGSYTNLYKSITVAPIADVYYVDGINNFIMAEEIEQEIEIEAWMLKPFKSDYFVDCLIPEKEDDISIEPWMTDLEQWKINKK